jgi:competence protein ComEC
MPIMPVARWRYAMACRSTVVGGETEGCRRFSALSRASAVSNGGGTVSFELWQWPDAIAGNPKSCVLQVQANGERLLLTGDIDRAAGAGVAQHAACGADRLAASTAPWQPQFSSWRAFLQRLAPKSVLISRGRAMRSAIPIRRCWRATGR